MRPPNVELVHPRNVGEAHVRYRARRHLNGRVTIAVWQRPGQNDLLGRNSSDRKQNVSRDQLHVLNVQRREWSVQRREWNVQRREWIANDHSHSRADLRPNLRLRDNSRA